MSVGGAGEASGGSYSKDHLMIFGIVGGLLGIYATHFLSDFHPELAFIGSIGSICAIIWGVDAVRRVCSYGLGTGVPSIGMLALGMGVVAALFGLSIAGFAGPIVAFIIACIMGVVIGQLANKYIGMNIPVMERVMVEIAGAGALTIMGFSSTIAGTFMFEEIMFATVTTGFIAVVYIAGGLAILHPFNASLGPDEQQDRTIMLGVLDGSIAMAVVGIAAMSIVTTVIGVALMCITYIKHYKFVKRDAYKILGTGLLPNKEELEG